MISRLWNCLPAIVRGILVAELVVSIGAIPPSVAVILNMRTSSIPWMVVVTAGWAMAFATARLAHLPREAFAAPIDFSKYPTLLVVSAVACISATAGVVEEAGFRGFLISPIQRRYGWTIAILISGIMFFLDHHLSHAYATFAFLPFFLAISVVHGLLVKYSGSIRPSMLLHAVADFIVIPVSYGLVGSFSVQSLSVASIDRQFMICVAVIAICFASFVPALRALGARSKPVAESGRPTQDLQSG